MDFFKSCGELFASKRQSSVSSIVGEKVWLARRGELSVISVVLWCSPPPRRLALGPKRSFTHYS